jgi:hypothetical protein
VTLPSFYASNRRFDLKKMKETAAAALTSQVLETGATAGFQQTSQLQLMNPSSRRSLSEQQQPSFSTNSFYNQNNNNNNNQNNNNFTTTIRNHHHHHHHLMNENNLIGMAVVPSQEQQQQQQQLRHQEQSQEQQLLHAMGQPAFGNQAQNQFIDVNNNTSIPMQIDSPAQVQLTLTQPAGSGMMQGILDNHHQSDQSLQPIHSTMDQNLLESNHQQSGIMNRSTILELQQLQHMQESLHIQDPPLQVHISFHTLSQTRFPLQFLKS